MDQDVVSVRSELQDIMAELSRVSDGDRLVEVLTRAQRYLGEGENPASAQEIAEFNKLHYSPLLRTLLANMGPQWFDFLTSDRLDLWDNFFLQGPADQAFLVLLDSLLIKPCLCLDRCVHVLEKFLRRGSLASIIWEVCQQQLEATPTLILHEVLLSKICNFPDHLANCLKKQTKSLFYPKNYYPCVGDAILHVLQMVSVSLREGKGCSISFISQLVGKICVSGHQMELLSMLVPRLITLVKTDCIWQRMCWRMIESVPERWMEPVVSGIVSVADGPETLSLLLGDLVLKNNKAQFLLTQKFLFVKFSLKKEKLLCVLGYLSMDISRRPVLVKVLQTLLEMWSSRGVVAHSSYKMLLNISHCIFISLTLLNKDEIDACQPEFIHALTSGLTLYLESSLSTLRSLGMAVAERLSSYDEVLGPKLSFEYEDDDHIRDLKSLISPLCVAVDSSGDPHDDSIQSSQSGIQSSEDDDRSNEDSKTDPNSDLDSDDDLDPYDMSGDTELKKSKVPAYIRDCIEVLMLEDLEKLEVTLSSISSLIRSNPSATKEVSTELVRILLHLDERPGVENFIPLRYSAMVSVTVIDPVPVSQYLTGEFYSVNYSLRQRLDILEVLATAAHELSQPVNSKKAKETEVTASVLQLTRNAHGKDEASVINWRKIVDERIASKTRHFAKGPSTTVAATPNRFHAVAGHFFFPLVQNYDKPVVTFDLLGEDSLILGRLVHTLGLMMHLAVHATIASQMGKALLEFIWVLRFHTDPFVRQSLLFCVSTFLNSVPWERIMGDMFEDVLEMKFWLSDTSESDIDEDCRHLAVSGLMLMEKLQGIHQLSPNQ